MTRDLKANTTILIVDDEPVVLKVAGVALRRKGFRVLTASSGREALTVCRAHPGPVHLALLDVAMPGMMGPELRDCLRVEFPSLVAVFMSGYSASELLEHGIVAEVTGYIQKPFTLTELMKLICGALNSRKIGRSSAPYY